MNKKIDVKMLVLDMDGTLLNKEHTISEKNKKYIQLAKERGVKVVLVSGRDVPALKNFSKILNLNEYIGAMNGAIVYDVKNEEIIGETYLRKEHVDKTFLKFRIIIMNCLLYLKIILFMLVINQILF